MAEFPADVMSLHVCTRTATGIVLADTCPSPEAFVSFSTGERFRELRDKHGLPAPVALEDGPVYSAIVGGTRI